MTTVQDLLSLGHENAMNTPSTVGPPNWCWRLQPGALTREVADRLLQLTAIYGRLPDDWKPAARDDDSDPAATPASA